MSDLNLKTTKVNRKAYKKPKMANKNSKAGRAMASVSPSTPSHRSFSTPPDTPVTPVAGTMGLLTPPTSVSAHGVVRRGLVGRSTVSASPTWSTARVSDGTPSQPSTASPPPGLAATSSSTAAVSSTSSAPFYSLPLEMKQQIAGLLESDQDVVHFSQTCKSINTAIEQDGCSFWRRRFLAKFEQPHDFESAKEWKSNVHFKKQYQLRTDALNKGALFALGNVDREVEVLRILRGIMLDSFSQQKQLQSKYPDEIYEDRNISALVRFCQKENLMKNLFNPRNVPARFAGTSRAIPERALQSIQVMLSPLLLTDPDGNEYDFPTSQTAAYSAAVEQPILKGVFLLGVDMNWVLHQINFWKYHLSRQAEGTLYGEVNELAPGEHPQLWDSHLSQDDMPALSGHWKGAAAFLRGKEFIAVRKNDHRRDLPDEFSGSDTAIQDFEFQMTKHQTSPYTLEIFKTLLEAHRKPKGVAKPRTRSSRSTDDQDEVPFQELPTKTFRFGLVKDMKINVGPRCIGDGWLSPLPVQCGIPGWQRMTMVKYHIDGNEEIDWQSLWAYEGVVFPGGRTIVGRWWQPNDDAVTKNQYSGPFILWKTG